MNLELTEIASNLNVSVSTVSRIITLFTNTGNVTPRKKACRINFSFTPEQELYIIGLIFEHPSMYLDEIVHEIEEFLRIEVSLSTVCRLLKRYGITRKKVRQVAQQRCYTLRGMYFAHIYNFDTEMLVWLDETGTDKRDQLRKYGYALRGLTPHYHRSLSRGQRVNAIASMSMEGLVALELVDGNVNGEVFYDFVRGSLIPNMQAFPNPNSVLILDNCSVHHTDEVTTLLQSAGLVTMYLPPYSPDMMPLEESFSYIKNYLRRHDEILQVTSDPRDLINEAFYSITKENFRAWIRHSGYNI